MNRRDYNKQYYARNRLKLKQKRLLSQCDSGIYLLENPHNKSIYIGASKNVSIRFKRHYSTSFQSWLDVCPRDDWKVRVILPLPPLDIQTYNIFETLLCMVYRHRGYTLLNKYNYDGVVDDLLPMVEWCIQYVSSEIQEAINTLLTEIGLSKENTNEPCGIHGKDDTRRP